MKNKLKRKILIKSFFLKILIIFSEKKISINKLISKNLNGKWSLGRLPKSCLSILSVAVSEIIVFPKTSINNSYQNI